jgi:hypothetical protein
VDDTAIYESYAKFAVLVGSPVLSFEDWARQRHANHAVEDEANKLRDKWLRSEKDVKMKPPNRATIERVK